MWSRAQQCRLELEEQLLARELPQFRLYRMADEACVSGWQSTASRSRDYQLKLVLCDRFPDEMPRLYVVSPRTLWQYGGYNTVNDEETTAGQSYVATQILRCAQNDTHHLMCAGLMGRFGGPIRPPSTAFR